MLRTLAISVSGTISEEVSAIGTLLANESVMIRPERDGRITTIHFNEGQIVRKGEKLISLDTAEIEAQLAGVNSDATLNRSRFKRAEELHEKKFISGQARDDAREALNQSLARQSEIRARFEKSTVLAHPTVHRPSIELATADVYTSVEATSETLGNG